MRNCFDLLAQLSQSSHISLFLCPALAVSVCLCLSLSVSVGFCLSLSICSCLFVSVCLFLSVLFVCLSVYLSVYLSLSRYLSLGCFATSLNMPKFIYFLESQFSISLLPPQYPPFVSPSPPSLSLSLSLFLGNRSNYICFLLTFYNAQDM